jgi:4-amino-4-deoxy-L-arabinose transferase-like glycosyltransferase
MQSLFVLLVLPVLLWAMVGLGAWLWPLLGFPRSAGLLQFVGYAGLGVACFSYLVMFLGLIGALYVWVVLGVTGLLVLVGVFSKWWSGSELKRGLFLCSRYEWIPAGLLLILTALNLFGALAPPVYADTLRYHLAAPKYYMARHQIVFVPIVSWNNPFAFEMFHLWGLLLSLESLGVAVGWLLVLLSALAVWGMWQQLFADAPTDDPACGGALWAALLFYALPASTLQSTIGKNDALLVFSTTMCMALVMLWLRTGDDRWAGAMGLFAGLAAATKLHGLILVGAVGLLVLIYSLLKDRTSLRRAVGPLLRFGVWVILVGSPWYIRTWVATGNPVWPLFNDIFGGAYWTASQGDVLRRFAALVGGKPTVLGFFAWIWRLFIDPGSARQLLYNLPPLVLACIPVIVLPGRITWRRRRLLLAGLFVCAAYFMVWFLAYRVPRYLYPLYPVLVSVGSAAAWEFKITGRGQTVLVWALILMPLLVYSGVAALYNFPAIRVVLGGESREAYLAQNVPFYTQINRVNQMLPEDSTKCCQKTVVSCCEGFTPTTSRQRPCKAIIFCKGSWIMTSLIGPQHLPVSCIARVLPISW